MDACNINKLSIVLVTRNSKSVLFNCLKALDSNDVLTSSMNSQWIIVDNNSTDGSIEEVEVILAFEFKDTKKEYVIYTKNEKDENDNVTVYVSNVDRSSGDPKLLGIDDEEEWNRVKDVLRELSKAE